MKWSARKLERTLKKQMQEASGNLRDGSITDIGIGKFWHLQDQMNVCESF